MKGSWFVQGLVLALTCMVALALTTHPGFTHRMATAPSRTLSIVGDDVGWVISASTAAASIAAFLLLTSIVWSTKG
jgi:hypothetical protein